MDDSACAEPLQLDEWPWVVPALEQWSPCPHPGGYDFTAREQRTVRRWSRQLHSLLAMSQSVTATAQELEIVYS